MRHDTEVSSLIATDRWHEAIAQKSTGEPSMRTFGLVMLIGFGLLGTLAIIGGVRRSQEWRLGLGVVLVAVGLTIFAWSLISPRTLPAVYHAWMSFGLRIGTLMTGFLLTVVYLVIVTPVGWLMRMTSRDPLDRTLAGGQN